MAHSVKKVVSKVENSIPYTWGILWVLPKIKFMPHIHPQQFNEVKQICVSALASLRSIISILLIIFMAW